MRPLMKAHIKAYYRNLGGKIVYVPEHDDTRPDGQPAGLHERTAMGRHHDGTTYLRATDAEDSKTIQAAAEKHSIPLEKRRRGATHHGRVGAYDHFHVTDPTQAATILQELGARAGDGNEKAGPNGGHFFHKGDRARYTGTTEEKHGGTWHEIEYLEGHRKGQKEWSLKGPAHATVAEAHQETNQARHKAASEAKGKGKVGQPAATPPIHAHADALIEHGKKVGGDREHHAPIRDKHLKQAEAPRESEATEKAGIAKPKEEPKPEGKSRPTLARALDRNHPAAKAYGAGLQAPKVQAAILRQGQKVKLNFHDATAEARAASQIAEDSRSPEHHQVASDAHWEAAQAHEIAKNSRKGGLYYSSHSKAQDHHTESAIHHSRKATELKGSSAGGTEPPKPNGPHTPESIAKLGNHEDYAGFGTFGHANYHAEIDRAVAEAANHHGLDEHQATAFLHGRSGRWVMDELDQHIPKEKAREANTLLEKDEDAGAKAWQEAHRAIPHETRVEHFKQWMDPKGSNWRHFRVDDYARELREREGGRDVKKSLPSLDAGHARTRLHHATLALNGARQEARNLLKALSDLTEANPFRDACREARNAGCDAESIRQTVANASGGHEAVLGMFEGLRSTTAESPGA
ncbi:MAG: hypothetical protein HYZ13_09105 [Acidobacteria bacterium]|nr:hypothetical protein [Acidobacteriota bacterium]